MESESWLSCEKTAILQGAFLLAEKLCGSGKLSDLRKEEWGRVGHPIRRAIISICGEGCGGSQDQILWRKRIVCILWRKLLEMEEGKDIDSAWKENPFFSVQNALPQVNRVVLYELIKSVGFFRVYVDLLLCFPLAGLCSELAKLVKHIAAESTKEDTQLLFEVWWDLWKAGGRQEQSLDQVFASQCSHYTAPGSNLALTASCVQSILFGALEEMKDHIMSSYVCPFALTVSLDTLYTSFLLNHDVNITPALYLESISRAVCMRESQATTEGSDLMEIIKEGQQELAATHRLPQFRPCGMTWMDAVRTLLTVFRAWQDRGLLNMPESEGPHKNDHLRLTESLNRVIKAMELHTAHEPLTEAERKDVDSLSCTLRNLAQSVSVPDLQCNSMDMARVAVAIIDQRLERYQDIARLFASEENWALSSNEWISCLKRNKDAFLHKDLVLKLASILVARCQTSTDIVQCKMLREIILDLFSELPLQDKNEALAAVLCSRGKSGLNGSLPPAISEGFGEEFNLSFNSLIQSRAESDISLAVSAVARVAFQDPEATLSRCCHMAVMNLGAETLLARVLQQLPGLIYPQHFGAEGQNLAPGELLSTCLQEAVQGKLATPREEGQFLNFLAALMNLSVAKETKEEGLSLLTPENVVQAFVLPYLSVSFPHACSLELSLQVLLCALKQDESTDSPHWLMSCSPFPLIAALCQLLNDSYACWEEPAECSLYVSIESKELLIGALKVIDRVVGREVAAAPGVWSRAVFWLHSKLEGLDWTVYFNLKSILGGHFKNEVPGSLLAVSELSDREWSGLELPQYGQGTGLLAWVECCCMPGLRETMLNSLDLDQNCPEQVTMFGKGLLVAVTQALAWCTAEEWQTLLGALRELLDSGRLYVPYSLEYVEFLPLLDLRSFACELRLSVLLLRVFQLLCGASCGSWMIAKGWAHVGKLYAGAVREMVASVKEKLPIPPPVCPRGPCAGQEGLFVLTQLFCHVLHVQVMLPGGTEPLFLCALEILTLYQSLMTAYPASSSGMNRKNTRHFLTTLTDNLECADMRAALHQKIAQL